MISVMDDVDLGWIWVMWWPKVCMVWRKGFWTWENVSYMILEEGLATVYTSMGAVYGEEGKEAFDVREQEARRRKVGMWSQKKSSFVSPKDYKRALRSND